ncbi:type II toxin-antitoxin system prevent-host-death family antitoxin [Streptomyces sp. NBC_01220]|uniref:type II toxin-antitoxin system Phd/YefM family antitoxin n=1 Tax=Streptomyces sp. NBC_01220 TaxID=2903781 RepID=UPI00352C22C1|nr:type II toxin-antitoxin system prevent-host-death family antitoxin [Streptomyces sp. NBC_01220]
MIQSIGVRELQVRLSAVLDAVRGGATYEVTRHSATVAYVVPPSVLDAAERSDAMAERLAQLEGRLSTAESDRSAAQMAQLEAEQRLRHVQDERDTLAEDVANLRDDFGMSAPAGRGRRGR